ncbi:MAG: hypothetical protein KW793_02800 [Candidatus Doudnabacteria bacterium]|nr:hypothetical protein [Candidatus Doudnabacteria bacterium]
MQEINLLQNKLKDTTNKWEKSNRTVNIVLGLVLIAELVAGGMLFMLTKSAEDSKVAIDQENAEIQSNLDKMEEQLVDAKGFQAQTKNIESLLQNHVVWSQIMDSMAASTFKASRYLNMTSDTTGVLNIEGITANYTDLGKMILALETNENLSSVRLLSTAPSTNELSGVVFTLEVMAKQDVFLSKQ